ncbi:hypothetical protein BDK51DRAFT_49603 [Blyttiomyces helicus]|uniref:Uncharacterized protein n=1 Tax=Blyttiomyces helicus TaxID=388810 RepID=A0A4P9W522_9FUNG|nr:hypothetical protein BDK51DRAFT_49603 [Blyttiomyces helicus]|eukprot:RKO87479.1 hypothetical protein BDK51DRAFT_49603 [Blyttiomyces helicus]
MKRPEFYDKCKGMFTRHHGQRGGDYRRDETIRYRCFLAYSHPASPARLADEADGHDADDADETETYRSRRRSSQGLTLSRSPSVTAKLLLRRELESQRDLYSYLRMQMTAQDTRIKMLEEALERWPMGPVVASGSQQRVPQHSAIEHYHYAHLAQAQELQRQSRYLSYQTYPPLAPPQPQYPQPPLPPLAHTLPYSPIQQVGQPQAQVYYFPGSDYRQRNAPTAPSTAFSADLPPSTPSPTFSNNYIPPPMRHASPRISVPPGASPRFAAAEPAPPMRPAPPTRSSPPAPKARSPTAPTSEQQQQRHQHRGETASATAEAAPTPPLAASPVAAPTLSGATGRCRDWNCRCHLTPHSFRSAREALTAGGGVAVTHPPPRVLPLPRARWGSGCGEIASGVLIWGR